MFAATNDPTCTCRYRQRRTELAAEPLWHEQLCGGTDIFGPVGVPVAHAGVLHGRGGRCAHDVMGRAAVIGGAQVDLRWHARW
jgi:hypothetical protein